MKTTSKRSITTVFAAFALAITYCSTTFAAGDDLLVLGEVLAKNQISIDSAGIEATLNDGESYVFFSGDTIKTSDDAAAEINLEPTGSVSIAPNSEIAVALVNDIYVIDVKQGALSYSFPEGTKFRVSAADNVVTPGGQEEIAGVVKKVAYQGEPISGALKIEDDGNLYVGSLTGNSTLLDTSGNEKIIRSGNLLYTGPASQSKIPLFAQMGEDNDAGGGAVFGGLDIETLSWLGVAGAATLIAIGQDDDSDSGS